MSLLKLKAVTASTDNDNPNDTAKKQIIDLGNASEVIYIQRFIPFDQSWKWFDYLDKHIPWTRPTIRVFGRSCVQVCRFPFSLENSLLVVWSHVENVETEWKLGIFTPKKKNVFFLFPLQIYICCGQCCWFLTFFSVCIWIYYYSSSVTYISDIKRKFDILFGDYYY